MVTVTTQKGRTYTGKTAEQVVMLLWHDTFMTESSPHLYMKAVAARVALLDGEPPIDTTDPLRFLRALAEKGHILLTEGETLL